MTTDPLSQLENSSAGANFEWALRVLRKRLWIILGLTVAIPALVGVVVSQEPKEFEASASIVIDPSVPQYLGPNFRDVFEMESNWFSEQQTLQTELRTLTSHSQSLAVAQALCEKKLSNQTPAIRLVIGSDSCTPATLDSAALLLQGLVRADPVKDSRIVNIIVDSHDSEFAALLANTSAQVYITRNLERRLTQSEGAASWLSDEYGDLSTQLNDAERQLIDFKKRNNVLAVGIADQQNDLAGRHKKLSDELNAIEVRLIGLRAQREQYALLKSDDPMSEVTPGVSDNPVVLRLKELYIEQFSKLVELHGKYLDKHPAVLAQEARLQTIKDDLQREASLAGKNVEAQYATAVKQERELRSALDTTTHDSLQLEQRAIEYNRLKRNFDHLQKLSEQVGGRERETSLAGHLKTNNVRMLDAARTPMVAISPNVMRSVGVALIAALLVSLALAMLLEFLDATVKTQEDVERIGGVSFLGLIPTIRPGAEPTASLPPLVAELARTSAREFYALAHPKSPVAECCRAIRTNLLFMSPDKPTRSMLITSAGPMEGKTTTSINLAVVMAQSGMRVLLVDTDMRRPRLHKAFGIPGASSGPGLSKAILGEADVLTLVRETGVPNLWLLPCGALPPNPAELLHADRFKQIVETLEGSFDRVLFDSPPIGAVTDAAILSQLIDGTLMVAKSGQTTKQALNRAYRTLSSVGDINVLGCILNDFDPDKQRGYGYQYYYHYARYAYAEGDEGDARPAKQSAG